MLLRRLLANALVNKEAFAVVQEEQPTNDESWASLAVFTQLILLALTFIVGHVLDKRKIAWLSEAGFALLLGVAVGVLVKFFAASETFVHWISFKKEFFFLALLPPIIFDAGFSLKVKPFFSNIGAICSYAFAGTTISTFVIGVMVWYAGQLGICSPLTMLESSVYGAIVSATDPVTVLAVFQRLNADENLYALVFGESVLNDAVAIVMYRTLTIFLDVPVTLAACLQALGTFCAIFLGSMFIGVSMALLASLALKTRFFRSEHMPLESCLVVLLAYSCYMLADGLALSGIVAILFCGMVMAHYTRPNLSRQSRDRTTAFSKMLATMSETFVFIYIGATLFLQDQAWDKGMTWAFLGVSLVALAVSRGLNVYPCTAMVNALRHPNLHVPHGHAFMVWFSGLRGAMAFALSLEAADDLPESAGRVISTSTFFIVLITVLVNGGACAYLLRALGLTRDQSVEHHNSEGLHDPSDSPILSALGSPSYSMHSMAAFHDDSPFNMPDDTHDSSDTPNSHSHRPKSPGGLLAKGLTRVREMNRQGVLSKLHKLDERFMSRVFLPIDPTEDGEGVELTTVHASSTMRESSSGGEQLLVLVDEEGATQRSSLNGHPSTVISRSPSHNHDKPPHANGH